MTITSKAKLVEPHEQFCSRGRHHGVWKRKTVTSCWDGQIVMLKADEEAEGSCCCDIIRVGDDFAIARAYGDPKQVLRDFEKISRVKLT